MRGQAEEVNVEIEMPEPTIEAVHESAREFREEHPELCRKFNERINERMRKIRRKCLLSRQTETPFNSTKVR
jgi:hypothetical protein